MEKVSFLHRWEPTEYQIGGQTIRMLFTMHAAARLEAALEKTYPEILLEALQVNPDPDGPVPPPMRIGRQAAMIRILMQEAGQDISPEDLQQMHMGDFVELARCAQMELGLKSWSENQVKKDAAPEKGQSLSGGQR